MILFNPNSLRKIAIFPYTNALFFENNFSYVPFLNHTNVYVKTPSFDYFLSNDLDNMKSDVEDATNFIAGAVESLKIDKIDYYESVNTFTYSDFISSPKNNVIKTAGSMSIPVLLPYNENQSFSLFQEAIWRIGVYPFIPFFIYSDVTPINLGGPLFSKQFNIKASQESAVNINLTFEGGTAIKSPDPGTIDFSEFPFNESYYNEVLDGSPITNTFVYRQAKTYDCLFGVPIDLSVDTSVGIYTSYSQQTQWYSNQNYVNIIEMQLTIDQDLTTKWTTNDGLNKNISDGMKVISMKKRKAHGTITFTASTDLTYVFSSPGKRIQELVMYFGGPFYFPMKNVNINIFDVLINGDNYYVHTLDFFAMYQPTTPKQYSTLKQESEMDWYKLNMFNISHEGIFEPIEGKVYVTPQ